MDEREEGWPETGQNTGEANNTTGEKRVVGRVTGG